MTKNEICWSKSPKKRSKKFEIKKNWEKLIQLKESKF